MTKGKEKIMAVKTQKELAVQWFIDNKQADLYKRMIQAETFGPVSLAHDLRNRYTKLLKDIEEGNLYKGK